MHFPDQGYGSQVQKGSGPALLGLVTPPSYCCLKPQILCEMNWVSTLLWSDTSAATGSYATSVMASMKLSPTWCMLIEGCSGSQWLSCSWEREGGMAWQVVHGFKKSEQNEKLKRGDPHSSHETRSQSRCYHRQVKLEGTEASHTLGRTEGGRSFKVSVL